MRTAVKFLFVGGVVIGVVALVGLLVMSGIARFRGVETVPLPAGSYIAGSAQGADYADAYRAKMEYSAYRHIEDVVEHAFQKGAEIVRSESEVVYEGVAPGVRYHISYVLDKRAKPPTLTVSTTVNHVNQFGSAYFFLVKPVHKLLLPAMVDRMAQVSRE